VSAAVSLNCSRLVRIDQQRTSMTRVSPDYDHRVCHNIRQCPDPAQRIAMLCLVHSGQHWGMLSSFIRDCRLTISLHQAELGWVA
jgi:hypothetical protein